MTARVKMGGRFTHRSIKQRATVGNDRLGGGEWARSLALAIDVERLISQLESAAGGED